MSIAQLLEESLAPATRDYGPRIDEGDEERTWAHLVEALNGKVSTFLTVFTSILVQNDQDEARNPKKRGYNPNRLPAYLGAIDRIKQRVSDVLDDDSKEAAQKLLDAIDVAFTPGNPGDKLRRVVRAYIEKGTLPKIPISKQVKAQMAAERAAAKAAKAAAKGNKPSEMAQAAESLLDSPEIVITEWRPIAEAGGDEWEFEVASGETKLQVDRNGKFKGVTRGDVSSPTGKTGRYTGTVTGAFYKKDWDNLVSSLKDDGLDPDDLAFSAVALPAYLYTTNPSQPLRFDHWEAEISIRAKSGKDMTPKLFMGAPPSLLFDATITVKMPKMEGIEEAQRVDAALAFPGEDDTTKPGSFKISSKALSLFKRELGDGWQPEQALFTRQRQVITDLSREELAELFGAERIDLAQDAIAGNPRKAFNKWLMMSAKVSPKLGKLVRAAPDNAALLFYLTVVRVSGRDMADIILKRYFETESNHIGAVKARMKVEALEEAILEARLASSDDIEEAIDEYDNIVKTMRNRVAYAKSGKGDDDWLRKSVLDEVRRMEQQSKILRRLLERE